MSIDPLPIKPTSAQNATNHPTPYPLAPSLKPGVWLIETCAFAIKMNLSNEGTESASIIAQSYNRIRCPHSPPGESEADLDIPEPIAPAFNFVRGYMEPGTNKTVCEHRYPSEAKPEEKRTARNEGSTSSVPHHREVTEQQLNDVYARYLAGAATSEDVLLVVIGYGQWRLQSGTKEFDLKERGYDDILGTFWMKMHRAVVNRSFRGDNGALFSHYVKSAWKKNRNGAYAELDKIDRLFETSATYNEDEEDDDSFQIGHEDQYALDSYRETKSLADSMVDAEELIAGLTPLQREILMARTEDEDQQTTTQRLNLQNRFVLGRELPKMKAKVSRAQLRRKSGLVA